MNKGPLFRQLRKELKAQDKKWVAPKCKKENTIIFVKKEHKGKQALRFIQLENGRWKVSLLEWDYKRDKQGIDGEKGKWKTVVPKKPRGTCFTWNKKQLPVVYKFSEATSVFNVTYDTSFNQYSFLANWFLRINCITATDFNQMICPVLKDLPEGTKIDKALKYADLSELFKENKVRGKVLRNWVLESVPNNAFSLTKKLDFLNKLGRVDVNVLQKATQELAFLLDRYESIRFESFSRFNNTEAFSKLLTKLKKKGRYISIFNDLFRLEHKYKKVVNKPFPKAITLMQYHDDLSRIIEEVHDPEYNTPFALTEEEKEINGKVFDKFRIQLPYSRADLGKWGSWQHHCIGSYHREVGVVLLSVWQGDRLLSCMNVDKSYKYVTEPVLDEKATAKWGKDMYVMKSGYRNVGYRVVQHVRNHNQDPNIPETVKKEIEEYILSVLNREVAVAA